MATLNLGIFAFSVRGKAGNSVFAKTKRGTVMRDRGIPSGVATAAQISVRNNMRKDGAAWQLLTPTQVANWNAYASRQIKKGKKSNKSYVPTGYQVYTGLTTKFYQINPTGTAPVAPPTTSFLGDNITLSAVAATGAVMFTASAANAANVKTELLLEPLKSKNRKVMPKGYVSKGFVAFATGALTSTVSVPSGYYAAGYRFVSTVTGQETGIIPIAIMTVTLSMEDGGEASAAGTRKKAA